MFYRLSAGSRYKPLGGVTSTLNITSKRGSGSATWKCPVSSASMIAASMPSGIASFPISIDMIYLSALTGEFAPKTSKMATRDTVGYSGNALSTFSPFRVFSRTAYDPKGIQEYASYSLVPLPAQSFRATDVTPEGLK